MCDNRVEQIEVVGRLMLDVLNVLDVALRPKYCGS